MVFFFFFFFFLLCLLACFVDHEGRWGDIFRRHSVQAGRRGGCRFEGARGFDSFESLAQGKGRLAGPSVAEKQNINTSYPSSNDNQRRRDHYRLVFFDPIVVHIVFISSHNDRFKRPILIYYKFIINLWFFFLTHRLKTEVFSPSSQEHAYSLRKYAITFTYMKIYKKYKSIFNILIYILFI